MPKLSVLLAILDVTRVVALSLVEIVRGEYRHYYRDKLDTQKILTIFDSALTGCYKMFLRLAHTEGPVLFGVDHR